MVKTAWLSCEGKQQSTRGCVGVGRVRVRCSTDDGMFRHSLDEEPSCHVGVSSSTAHWSCRETRRSECPSATPLITVELEASASYFGIHFSRLRRENDGAMQWKNWGPTRSPKPHHADRPWLEQRWRPAVSRAGR